MIEILLFINTFFIMFNFVILIFMSIFLVRLRDVIMQSNLNVFSNLKSSIGNLTQKSGNDSWDKKYETELEKLNERLKSGSNLNDL